MQSSMASWCVYFLHWGRQCKLPRESGLLPSTRETRLLSTNIVVGTWFLINLLKLLTLTNKHQTQIWFVWFQVKTKFCTTFPLNGEERLCETYFLLAENKLLCSWYFIDCRIIFLIKESKKINIHSLNHTYFWNYHILLGTIIIQSTYLPKVALVKW